MSERYSRLVKELCTSEDEGHLPPVAKVANINSRKHRKHTADSHICHKTEIMLINGPSTSGRHPQRTSQAFQASWRLVRPGRQARKSLFGKRPPHRHANLKLDSSAASATEEAESEPFRFGIDTSPPVFEEGAPDLPQVS